MRYLPILLAMTLAGLGALPQTASAEAGEEGATSEPNLEEPAPPSEPTPQLELDAAGVEVVRSPPPTADGYPPRTKRNLEEPAPPSEPTVEERDRGVRRWHPEAFVDPSKPASEPALKLEVDSAAVEVTPTAPPTLEELERQEKKRRRRAIGIGVGVVVGVALVGVMIGGAVAMSNFEF